MRKQVATLAATVVAIMIGATSASAITNGTPDGDNHPYVGLLITIDLDTGLASGCSGSLIGEGVFLTAGHCTDGAELAFVWFDETWDGTLASADAAGTPHTNPGFCLACGNGLPGFARRDVGVVTFDAILGDVPSEHASLPTAGQVDSLRNKTPIDFVGYGVTFQARIPGSELPQPPPFFRWDGFGTRMYAPNQIGSGHFSHSAEFMKVGQNASQGGGGTCFGDSGGPNLLGGSDTVLGVNSYGANPNCSGIGYAQRVDIPDILNWISEFLA
jgi:Trypsin